MMERIERLEEKFDYWLNNNVTPTKTAIVLGSLMAFGLIATSVAV